MNLLTQDLGAVEIRDTHGTLTKEQAIIVDHEPAVGELAKIIAYAGTGKTSTFVAYANARPAARMTYLAFNKSVELDAKRRFGSNVTAKTVHALAFGAVGKRFGTISGSVQNWMIAKAVRCPIYNATIIARTLETFLNSAEDCVELKHVEPDRLNRLKPNYEEEVVKASHEVWKAVQSQSDGFSMTHSGYLKLYQLSKPTILGDYILLDEAQDTNPVTEALVLDQLTKGKRVLMCGDPYQQIYAWRGAEDAMSHVNCPTFRLTQSWRFGPNVADPANKILSTFYNETVPLIGMKNYAAESAVNYTNVCRTNAQILSSVASLALANLPFHVIGKEGFYVFIEDLLDVFFLYCGKRENILSSRICRHKSYGDLKEFADSTLDIELRGKCSIIDKYKDQIPHIVAKIREHYHITPAPETPIYTTCHKAKGLEWDHVRVSDDFEPLYTDTGKLRNIAKDDLTKDEVNLLYVATTRAKKSVQLNSELRKLCSQSRHAEIMNTRLPGETYDPAETIDEQPH